MEKPPNAFAQLDRHISRLEPSDRKVLEKCLSNLLGLVRLAADRDSTAQESLSQVARYTTKKLMDVELSSSSAASGSAAALRQLRNEVIHGKSLKRIDYLRVKKMEPVLWRTLEMSAQLWDPNELSNFLTYCLRTEGPRLDARNVEPKKLVRVYRAVYNTLDESDKERAFKELALRLFSEKRFVVALEESFAP